MDSTTGEATVIDRPSPAPMDEIIRREVPLTRDEASASARARKATRAAHASGRRRFVDPATCERDYSAAEWEFLRAIEEYKRSSGRMFPTWSEVLEVVRNLGYQKAGA
jgi:hypothetical protein